MNTMSQEMKNEKHQITVGFFMRLFIPFALAFFMSCILRTINSVLSPTFIETFQMSASDLGIMTSAYFFSFAIAQIPLGVCFDRFGPCKALGVDMLLAVVGCFIFASAQNVTFLFVGRALVGFGVAGCLMAAYKEFGDWLPKEKLPMYNSLESFVGGVGGMVATTPINIALDFMSWRTVFIVLGVITLGVALTVFFAPNKKGDVNETMGKQFAGAVKIAATGRFWRLAPVAVMGQATYLAMNSLWIGPWFKDVFHAGDTEVPNLLLLCATAITVGYLVNGFVANWLKAKFKVPVYKTIIGSMALYTVCLFMVALYPQGGKIFWTAFVFLGPFSLLSYPVFSDIFEVSMSGRAQTMYNMLVFIMSTVIQSGVGMIIDMYEPTADGGYSVQGYTTAILILAAILAFTVLWAVFFRRNKKELRY